MNNLKNTSLLFGANRIFVEELYEKYLNNPNSVDLSWQDFFKNFDDSQINVTRLNKGASWKKIYPAETIEQNDAEKKPSQKIDNSALLSLRACIMANEYRIHGHMLADIDPLNMQKKYTPEECGLHFSNFGFEEKDFNTKFDVSLALQGYGQMTVSEFISTLNYIYANKVGIEYMHVSSSDERQWLADKIEVEIPHKNLEKNEKKHLIESLIHAQMFEEYLHVKFPGAKRFSVEGGETSIAATEFIIEQAANSNIERVVIGMAHRGRLNTLTRIMGKSYTAMLSEFQGNLAYPEDMKIMGDVKYHLGYSNDKTTNSGKKIHLTLVPNPSHLETVDPVVAGKVRAEQDLINDKSRHKVMGILIHGDAAFAGQGVVPESLVQSELDGYTSGGIIHIIVNNQIGFTTDYIKARKSRYPSENAKSVKIPIFHINGDDAESVAKYSKLAVDYRNKFKKDVVLDITCYRLYGHNEGDEPNFTQPLMYKKIVNHTPASETYANKLISENIITNEEYVNIKNSFRASLDSELANVANYKPDADWLKGHWEGFEPAPEINDNEITGVPTDTLKKLCEKLCEYPNDFKINPKIARQLDAKKNMAETGKNIDWGTGEALAFASLLIEGYYVRLSGQDAGRGTFSHRHSVLVDQENGNNYLPLNHLTEGQAEYEVTDSNLSEYAALGFEYGYSMTHPKTLAIWEAQFGDFANGAQIIIDQYITSAETKWLRMSGLVMLLPHGMEGQGPEHSSARLERYLQLCATNNIQVIYPTTPANIFHALRRQLHRNFRKPLIVMTPKSLLRHKLAVSNFDEMKEDTYFLPVIGDNEKLNNVRKVIICSGKIYYDLFEERQKQGIKDIAIIRLEQFYPFPEKELLKEIQKYSNSEVIWCQEEHKNSGGYYFVMPRMFELLKQVKAKNNILNYVGRPEAASPASGYKKIHDKEQTNLVLEALK